MTTTTDSLSTDHSKATADGGHSHGVGPLPEALPRVPPHVLRRRRLPGAARPRGGVALRAGRPARAAVRRGHRRRPGRPRRPDDGRRGARGAGRDRRARRRAARYGRRARRPDRRRRVGLVPAGHDRHDPEGGRRLRGDVHPHRGRRGRRHARGGARAERDAPAGARRGAVAGRRRHRPHRPRRAHRDGRDRRRRGCAPDGRHGARLGRGLRARLLAPPAHRPRRRPSSTSR